MIKTRYKKLADSKFYGKLEIKNSTESDTLPPGYIYAPYISVEYEMGQMSPSETYTSFMKKYDEEHLCCPNCKEEGNFRTTLMYFVFYEDKPEEYKDLNECTCMKCKNIHTYHDRKPR